MIQTKDPIKIVGGFVAAIMLLTTAAVLLAITGKSNRPLIVSFVEDASKSTRPGNQCLRQSVKDTINSGADQIEFMYLHTGDESTAFEPVQPVEPLRIRRSDIPWGAGPTALNKLIDQFLATIPTSSRERSEKSPISISVERAVAAIRSRDDATRIIVVAGDLEDTTVPAMIQAFKEPPGTKLKNLPKIDNTGIHVHFVSIESTVGYDQTSKRKFTGPRTPERIMRLQEVWKGSFTAPDFVSFSVTCNDPIP